MGKKSNGKCLLKQSLLLALCAVFLLVGCVGPRSGGTASVATPDFFGFSEYLAEQLVANSTTAVQGEKVILATMVRLDDLYDTSSFGRVMTESLATSLFRHGFRVAEVRKAPSLFVKGGQGEFFLTRDVALMAQSQEVQAIVTGTYTLTPTTVIINVRLLEAASEEVLSVAGMELQRSHTINYLLTEKGQIIDAQLSVLER